MPYADPEKKRANERERQRRLRLEGSPEWLAQKRAAGRRYRKNHPDRAAESARKWREAHPGWRDKYRGTPEEKAYQRAYHLAHAEERAAAQKARYHQEPDKHRLWAMTHWSRKRDAEQGPIDIEAIVIRDRGRCGVCGKRVAVKNRSLDHIVPLSKGGAHRQENLQLTHLICNQRRGAGRIAAQLPLPL